MLKAATHQPTQHCLINGVHSDFISVMDRGLHYGDGLFETLLYKDGQCQCWDQHLHRMQLGAEKLKIPFPGEHCYYNDVTQLAKQAQHQNSIFKLLLTRGMSQRGYATLEPSEPKRIVTTSPYHAVEDFSDGVKATLCKQTVSINKGLAGLKHLNRLENVIARNEWRDEFQEGIMLDDNNHVIEGTMSNVFIIKDKKLLTPSLISSGVTGIMRDNILNCAKHENIATQIKNITLDELLKADEIFLTNSIIGLWPVKQLNNVVYKIGDITKTLQSKLNQYCQNNAKTIK